MMETRAVVSSDECGNGRMGKGKGKVHPRKAMEAQRGSRGIVLLFL
jgi:hypothetical protein